MQISTLTFGPYEVHTQPQGNTGKVAVDIHRIHDFQNVTHLFFPDSYVVKINLTPKRYWQFIERLRRQVYG